jgi:hypothetical protein
MKYFRHAFDALFEVSSVRKAFVASFFILSVLPLAQMIVPFVRVRPMYENRLPAPFPDVAKILRQDGRLAAGINRWFDDRVGFRTFLIRLKNQIDYSVFGHSNQVYIARDGSLIQRDFVAAKVGFERGGEAWQQKAQSLFVALARYLTHRDIRLVIVSNPGKEAVHPDLLPPDAPHFPVVTQLWRLREFLKQGTAWSYVDGQDEMTRCGRYAAFYRLDLHSTEPVTHCIAEAVVARIAVAEGRPKTFWQPNFSYHEHPSWGLPSYLSLLVTPVDTRNDVLDRPFEPGELPPDGAFASDPEGFFELIYRSSEALRAQRLPPVVVYGNSFVDQYLQCGFYFQFAEAYRVRSNGMVIETMLSHLPSSARYVVLQFFDGFLGQQLASRIPND